MLTSKSEFLSFSITQQFRLNIFLIWILFAYCLWLGTYMLRNMRNYPPSIRMHSSRMCTVRSSSRLSRGVCLSACWDTNPPGTRPPPKTRHPPGTRHPRGADPHRPGTPHMWTDTRRWKHNLRNFVAAISHHTGTPYPQIWDLTIQDPLAVQTCSNVFNFRTCRSTSDQNNIQEITVAVWFDFVLNPLSSKCQIDAKRFTCVVGVLLFLTYGDCNHNRSKQIILFCNSKRNEWQCQATLNL